MGVVLYKPSYEQLNNLKRYSDISVFERIYVYDNSANEINIGILPSTARYVFLNGNHGLSRPYNLMIENAEKEGFDFLCIMDQDTIFEEKEIHRIKDYLRTHRNDLDNVTIVCPNIATCKEDIKRKDSQTFVKWTINSASFLNLKNLKRNSFSYDENVFLDGVDYEFCMNIRKHNQKILRIDDAYIVQRFGCLTNGSSFAHHEATRYYYMARSRQYMYKKHYGVFGSTFALLLNIRLVGRILLHEDNKLAKVKACIKGIFK